ncbi:MAG: carbohydrate ABC transporter permease [bacterium]|nr:carbohydrate ABC transporter permease [bacterium]
MNGVTDRRGASRLLGRLELAVIWVVTAAALAPFLWLMLTAFKHRTDVMSPTPKILFSPTLSNFYEAFVIGPFTINLINSLVTASASTLLCLVLGLPAAYAFSRFRVYGEKHVYFYVLTTRMAPGIALVLPLYMFFQSIGLLGTLTAVTVAQTTFNLALVIYLMRNFFNDIPRELDEAALTEGAGEWQVFVRIILPLARPGIAVTAMISFLFAWNEFLFAFMIGGTGAQTLPAAFPGLVTPHGTYWGQLAAASVVVSIPVLIMIWFIQRHLTRGLTFGAVK